MILATFLVAEGGFEPSTQVRKPLILAGFRDLVVIKVIKKVIKKSKMRKGVFLNGVKNLFRYFTKHNTNYKRTLDFKVLFLCKNIGVRR